MTTLAEVQERAEGYERKAVRAALVAANGNMRIAAAALGCSYATIKRRVAAHGLGEWLREKYPLSVRQPKRKRGG